MTSLYIMSTIFIIFSLNTRKKNKKNEKNIVIISLVYSWYVVDIWKVLYEGANIIKPTFKDDYVKIKSYRNV